MALRSLRVTLGAAILASQIRPTLSAGNLNARTYIASSGYEACPVQCAENGFNASQWSYYHSLEELQGCDQKPKLLDFTIHNPLDSEDTHFVIRSCSTVRGPLVFDEHLVARQDMEADEGLEEGTVDLELVYALSDDITIPNQKVTAVREIQASLLLRNDTIFSQGSPASYIIHYGDTVVGVFIGEHFDTRSAALGPLEDFLQYAIEPEVGTSRTIAVQACDKNSTRAATMGFIADTSPDEALFRVQAAMKAWSDAECVEDLGDTESFGDSFIYLNKLNRTASDNHLMAAEAECRTIQVISGDGCDTLAKRCGITGSQLSTYNPKTNFCSTLRPGQHVCCSKGDLPDIRPKPKPDGSCASYIVKSGDTCAQIAASNGLETDDLDGFNKKTWGWSGCKNLGIGINMCLSSGSPQLPAPIEDAQCGPQMPGTVKPPAGTDLADLNPCPLNACCNVWGNCGTTADFCTEASLGPPGTSEPGKNGCVANCGTEIVNNNTPPSQFMKVGYFEAWNKERPCLHMDISQLPTDLTHVHFAFGDVGPGFSVSATRLADQFSKFKALKNTKRIIAFGGWTASTHPSSYWIFREGIKPGNRETLATNLANFVTSNNLDGIDIDWEYPGAPDIPDIPAADPLDGEAYLELLKLLRQKLPNKSLSIAAPASYWYLKQFPIKEISQVVNYIIYMTYDLHGQWDWNSPWANPGCAKGNCLRSHVNITETMNALTMVTKAGVPSNKIVVGVTSYGRSFRMTNPSCTGPHCNFSGPQSGAKPGRCTGEPGYLANAEIKEIAQADPDARVYFDEKSKSNVLVYGNDWVAYMDKDEKNRRTQLWKSLNFGGTTDWAVDLDNFMSGDGDLPGGVFPELPTDWKDIDCDQPLAMDENAKASLRWSKLKCDEAWEYAVGRWKTRDKSLGKEFTDFVSNVLSGPRGFYCGTTVEDNGCSAGVACGDTHGLVAGPALVLSSLGNMDRLYMSLYNGIKDAHSSMLSMLEEFASNFAPEKEADEALLGFLDFLSTGLGLVAGPAFSKLFESSKFFTNNEEFADAFEETVMSGVDYGLEEAKKIVEEEEGLPTLELASALFTFVDHWKNFTERTQAQVFKGDESSIEYLGKMMANGKLIYGKPESAYDTEKRLLRAFFIYMIPYAWSLRGVRPALIETGWGCDKVGVGDYDYLQPGDDDVARICVDDKQYFLLYPDGPSNDCNRFGICDKGVLSVPPGIEKLGETDDKGNSFYGGVTRFDIANSIIERASKTGNKNLDKVPSLLDDENVKEDLWTMISKKDSDAAFLAGMVRIPKCKPETVYQNWKKDTVGQDTNWPAFPCDKALDYAMFGHFGYVGVNGSL